MIVLQLLVPGLSFAGHLSGIVAGTLQLYGLLDCVMPSETKLLEMDEWACFGCLRALPSFVATTTDSGLPLELPMVTRRRAAISTVDDDNILPAVLGSDGPSDASSVEQSEKEQLMSSHDEDGEVSEASKPASTSHVV